MRDVLYSDPGLVQCIPHIHLPLMSSHFTSYPEHLPSFTEYPTRDNHCPQSPVRFPHSPPPDMHSLYTLCRISIFVHSNPSGIHLRLRHGHPRQSPQQSPPGDLYLPTSKALNIFPWMAPAAHTSSASLCSSSTLHLLLMRTQGTSDAMYPTMNQWISSAGHPPSPDNEAT